MVCFVCYSERKLTTKSRDDQTATIQSVLPGKTYQFRVVGNSNHGPGESSNIFELTTQPDENIAGAVRNVIGQAISHKEIHVRWTPPQITNGNISKYRIYYTEPDGVDMYVDSAGPETDIILSELHPFTDYSVYVVPFNENGMGDASHEITVKTFSSIPGEAPLNVTLEATSSTVCIFDFISILNKNKYLIRFFVCVENVVNNDAMATTAAGRAKWPNNRLQNSISQTKEARSS